MLEGMQDRWKEYERKDVKKEGRKDVRKGGREEGVKEGRTNDAGRKEHEKGRM